MLMYHPTFDNFIPSFSYYKSPISLFDGTFPPLIPLGGEGFFSESKEVNRSADLNSDLTRSEIFHFPYFYQLDFKIQFRKYHYFNQNKWAILSELMSETSY